jgi:DNA-binding beta-propeller fold protein YncE
MRAVACGAVALLISGCASDANFGAGAFRPDLGFVAPRCFGANDCAPGEVCNEFGVCVAQPPATGGATDAGTPPPPPEVVSRREPPASGKRYVYVAISDEDTVARIDSIGLGVSTISVGGDPGALRTVPGADVAVVLNRASATATVIRSRADGGDDLAVLPTAANLNQLSLSPDGHYGIAWFDERLTGGSLAPQRDFQDATLLVLDPAGDRAVDLSIGFRPSEVQFARDGSTAFVITDDGVSIVRFAAVTAPEIVPTVAIRRDPSEAQPAQVQVTGDGALALARLPGLEGVRVVDLASGVLSDVPLGSTPSDLALSPDGAVAVIALRDAGQVALARLPGDLADPSRIALLPTSGYTAGQAVIAPDGAHAFVFTNAVAEKAVLVVDLPAGTLAPRLLQKGVRAVLPAPDGHAAIIVHNRVQSGPPPSDAVEQYIDSHEAYSLLDLQSGYLKLQLVDAAPGDVAFAPDSGSAYLLQSDPGAGVRALDAIDLHGFVVNGVVLGSPPVAVGVVPSTSQVYVAQDHPLGRMTFVDTATFHTRTLTGYGLNSQIIE